MVKVEREGGVAGVGVGGGVVLAEGIMNAHCKEDAATVKPL